MRRYTVLRVHEREDARLLFLRLLDHDADAELHERLAEVDDAFSQRGDCHRSDANVGFLRFTSATTGNITVLVRSD